MAAAGGSQGIVAHANADLRTTSTHERFAVMDGLRGIAALAVVLLHSFVDRGHVPNAPLAVDLFFILSGFVIAFSYERRLATSMTRRQFLLSRFIRLYPMVFIGAAGGIAIALVHNRTHPAEAYPIGALLASGALSLMVLPYLTPNRINDQIFSFNPPLWSLFFELVANLLYVLVWRRLTVAVLVALVAAGLAGVAWLGPLGGNLKGHYIGGLPRVVAGFFGGVLLLRLWSAGRLPRIRGNIVVLGAVLVGLFCLPREIGGLFYLPAYALLWLVVLCAANARPSFLDRYSEFLGSISYPVYLGHWLTLYLVTGIGNRLGLTGPLYPYVALFHLLATPFIGYAVLHYYETPVRSWLKARLGPARRPASA